jgi:hypothetical protein
MRIAYARIHRLIIYVQELHSSFDPCMDLDPIEVHAAHVYTKADGEYKLAFNSFLD